MIKHLTLAVALLYRPISSSSVANENYGPGLGSCQLFASKFANTCTSEKAGKFSDIPTKDFTCPIATVGKCIKGATSGSDCIWKRKLCVTCHEKALEDGSSGSVTRIRT